jgi:hypothetical protein
MGKRQSAVGSGGSAVKAIRVPLLARQPARWSTLRRLMLGAQLATLALSVFPGGILAAESVAKKVGGVLIPPPAGGLVDVSELSEEFRQLAKAGLESGQVPIGLYFLPSQIAVRTNQLRSPTGRAHIMLSYVSEESAKKGFNDEMGLAERDFQVMRFSSKEMQELIEFGGKDVRAIPGLPRLNLKGMTFIEKDLPRDRPGYVIALANASADFGGSQMVYTIVYCVGWQRVKDRIIQLVYSVTFKDEKSIVGLL